MYQRDPDRLWGVEKEFLLKEFHANCLDENSRKLSLDLLTKSYNRYFEITGKFDFQFPKISVQPNNPSLISAPCLQQIALYTFKAEFSEFKDIAQQTYDGMNFEEPNYKRILQVYNTMKLQYGLDLENASEYFYISKCDSLASFSMNVLAHYSQKVFLRMDRMIEDPKGLLVPDPNLNKELADICAINVKLATFPSSIDLKLLLKLYIDNYLLKDINPVNYTSVEEYANIQQEKDDFVMERLLVARYWQSPSQTIEADYLRFQMYLRNKAMPYTIIPQDYRQILTSLSEAKIAELIHNIVRLKDSWIINKLSSQYTFPSKYMEAYMKSTNALIMEIEHYPGILIESEECGMYRINPEKVNTLSGDHQLLLEMYCSYLNAAKSFFIHHKIAEEALEIIPVLRREAAAVTSSLLLTELGVPTADALLQELEYGKVSSHRLRTIENFFEEYCIANSGTPICRKYESFGRVVDSRRQIQMADEELSKMTLIQSADEIPNIAKQRCTKRVHEKIIDIIVNSDYSSPGEATFEQCAQIEHNRIKLEREVSRLTGAIKASKMRRLQKLASKFETYTTNYAARVFLDYETEVSKLGSRLLKELFKAYADDTWAEFLTNLKDARESHPIISQDVRVKSLIGLNSIDEAKYFATRKHPEATWKVVKPLIIDSLLKTKTWDFDFWNGQLYTLARLLEFYGREDDTVAMDDDEANMKVVLMNGQCSFAFRAALAQRLVDNYSTSLLEKMSQFTLSMEAAVDPITPKNLRNMVYDLPEYRINISKNIQEIIDSSDMDFFAQIGQGLIQKIESCETDDENCVKSINDSFASFQAAFDIFRGKDAIQVYKEYKGIN